MVEQLTRGSVQKTGLKAQQPAGFLGERSFIAAPKCLDETGKALLRWECAMRVELDHMTNVAQPMQEVLMLVPEAETEMGVACVSVLVGHRSEIEPAAVHTGVGRRQGAMVEAPHLCAGQLVGLPYGNVL